MSMFLIIFSTLFIQTLADFNATEFCSFVKNGTQLKDPTACNTWIECLNLQPVSHNCPQNQFYSLQTGTCEDAQSVDCISSNPCAVLTSQTGFVPDPLSCNHYYYCNENVPTLGSCQNNGSYNASTQTCVSNSTCSITLLPDDYCNIIPELVFIKNPSNCADYQYCYENILINSTCPQSYYFDAFEGVCTQNMTKACDLQTVPTQPPSAEVVSSCMLDGQFISDGKTCNGYYYCEKNNANDNYTLIHGNCPAGRFFSGDKNGVCVPRTQIVCKYDRCAGFGLQNIQLANLSDDDCKGYAVCQNGVQIGAGVCPDNEYYDELQQRCIQTVVSYPACLTTTTTTIAGSTDATTTETTI